LKPNGKILGRKSNLLLQTTLKTKTLCVGYVSYPSGAGLHVHPLGYIASDVYARYKRHQGFNVCTRWVMTVLDCRLNNMPFKLDNVRRYDISKYCGFDKEGNKIAGYRKQVR
jgi:leucyl-tRNA synthetase